MIIYLTRLTYDRLHIQPSEQLHYEIDHIYPQFDFINSIKLYETWSGIYEWYAELFYFRGKKYLRVVHLGSMFTLYFADVDEKFMYGLGIRIRKELLKYFIADTEARLGVKQLYRQSYLNFYSRIKDKTMLKHYRLNEYEFNKDKEPFTSFIDDSGIDTVGLTKYINSKYLFKEPGNKGKLFLSCDKLSDILSKSYNVLACEKLGVPVSDRIEMTPREIEVYSD